MSGLNNLAISSLFAGLQIAKKAKTQAINLFLSSLKFEKKKTKTRAASLLLSGLKFVNEKEIFHLVTDFSRGNENEKALKRNSRLRMCCVVFSCVARKYNIYIVFVWCCVV